MNDFSLCEIPVVLQIIYFVKILINLIKFLVPMGMIIMVIIDLGKGVISGDEKIGNILKTCGNRFLAAILIFLIPTIVNFTLSLVDDMTSYESCWVNANKDDINKYQVLWDEKIAEIESKEEEEKIPDKIDKNPEYVDFNSHTNSINGIKYKLYNQSDEAWGNVLYPSGKSISKIGCMITSIAVISSAYDSKITPLTVFNSDYRHSYAYNGINNLSDNNFKCNFSKVNKNNIIRNLQAGNVMVIFVKEESFFTNSQHYMALIDIKRDGSQIFVGNSYNSGEGTYNRNGWFDTDVVLTDVREVHLCVPLYSLINKFK